MTNKKKRRPPVPRSSPKPAAPAPAVPSAAAVPATTAAPSPNEKAELTQRLQDLEAATGNRTLTYWTSPAARMSHGVVVPLYDQLTKIGKQETLDLFLYTTGGDTEAPWRIVSLLREFTTTLRVLVPHMALSSGTLLALGANEVVMTPLAVMGPIDPSRTHPLLPRREGAEEAEPVSVQDMRHAMQFIRDAVGEQTSYTPEAMAEIFKALFDKIHPLAIGAIEQSYALSKLIAKRCLETHMDPANDANEIERIVDHLCDELKSHAYQIGRAEARTIGMKVTDADDATEKALMELYRFYAGRPVAPGVSGQPKPGMVIDMHIAWMDSTDLQFRAVTKNEVQANGALKIVGDEWVSY